MSEARVEKVVRVLLSEGCGPGTSIHGWRCEYPERYGACTCVADVAAEIVQALDDDGDRP